MTIQKVIKELEYYKNLKGPMDPEHLQLCLDTRVAYLTKLLATLLGEEDE